MNEIFEFILGAIWAVGCPIMIYDMIRNGPWTKDHYEVSNMASKKHSSLTTALLVNWFVNIVLIVIAAYSWKVLIWDNIF